MTDIEAKEILLEEIEHDDRVNAKKFHALVAGHLDAAEEVYKETPNSLNKEGRAIILAELNKAKRGVSLALEAARSFADELEFCSKETQDRIETHWSDEDEKTFRKWIACETDDLPSVIPKLRFVCVNGISYEWEMEQFAAMSVVCECTARFCVYALYLGHILDFKYPFRGIINYMGEDYADDFIRDLKKNYIETLQHHYQINEDDIMIMFASIYVQGGKTKKETLYYGRWIEQWMANNQEHFLAVLRSIRHDDIRKKILKKLFNVTK